MGSVFHISKLILIYGNLDYEKFCLVSNREEVNQSCKVRYNALNIAQGHEFRW